MGRKRLMHTHLPVHLQFKRGAYYYVSRVDGKQHWIPLGRDYMSALHKWSDLQGTDSAPVLTVADALNHYLADRAPKLAVKTMQDYRLQAKTLTAVFGMMRLADLRQSHVFTYLKKRDNVAGNRERDLLRAAINHARNLDFRGENPCVKMQFRNLETPRDRYIEDEELAALVKAATTRFGLILQWLYLTGMRIGDMISFRVCDASEDGLRWRQHKTGQKLLVEWSDTLREVYKAAAGHRIGAQPLFPSQRGDKYTLNGLESTFARVRKRAGVADVTLHDIRRKAGSDLELSHAQALLGHTTVEMTKRHYRAKAQGVKPVK